MAKAIFNEKKTFFSISLASFLTFILFAFSSAHAANLVINETTGATYTDLQVAIDAASAGDTLKTSGTFVGSFTIDKSLDINGQKKTILDGNSAGRVLEITTGTPLPIVRISCLTIQNGVVTGTDTGGGILNAGILTLRNVKVLNNSAVLSGGGISNLGTSDVILNLINCFISGNEAGSGAGVDTTIGNFIARGTKFTLNIASDTGGALRASNSEVIITDSVFEQNESTNGGGALFFETENNATLQHVLITKNNSTSSDGGGIYVDNTTLLNIAASEISENTAANRGGGIYINNDTDIVNIANSSIVRNIASDGGGVYNNGGDFNRVNTIISNNTPNDIAP